MRGMTNNTRQRRVTTRYWSPPASFPVSYCVIVVFVFCDTMQCCEEAAVVAPSGGRVLWCDPGEFAIAECLPGHHAQGPGPHPQGTSAGVVWCNRDTQQWLGTFSECVRDEDPCRSEPCLSGGVCLTNEDPYGWGFYCNCRGPHGGKLCQIENPCDTVACPAGTETCRVSWSSDKGRNCYDGDGKHLD